MPTTLILTILVALLLIQVARQQLHLWADRQVIAALQKHKLEADLKSRKAALPLADAAAWSLLIAALLWALRG
ncbi:MAG: hypothetical protein WAW03_11625 [Anaerolineae bacterium]